MPLEQNMTVKLKDLLGMNSRFYTDRIICNKKGSWADWNGYYKENLLVLVSYLSTSTIIIKILKTME